MLANHFGTLAEGNEENSTFFTIPVDFIRDSNGQPSMADLQDLFIGQMPDGTYCLLNNASEEFAYCTYDGLEQQYPNLQIGILPTVESVHESSRISSPINQISNKLLSFGNGQIYNEKLQEESNGKPELQNTSEIPLLKNIKAKTNAESYKCIKCDNLFPKLSELQYHLKWHKSQKKFKCVHCKAGYKIERNLDLHVAIVHSDGNLTKCPVCQVTFTSQRSASLKSHMMLHQIEELYTCDKCKSEFDHEDEFLKHMLTHSQEDFSSKLKDTHSFSCNHCKLQFQNSKDLRRHVSSHVRIKRFFNRQRRFNRPKEVVTKDKKFICNICSKAFIKKSLLDRHCRIHSGEKPFKCPLCDRSFSQKSTLNVHLTKHTGIRPYACTLCPAKFGQKGNLRVHIQKTHTVRTDQVDQLFRCAHCTCVFKKVSSLNAHVTRIHVNEKYPLDVDNVLENLIELEKITSKNIGSNEVLTSIGNDLSSNASNIEVAGKEDTTEDEDGVVNDIIFDDQGLRTMVTLSEVLNDGSLRKYLVRLKKSGDTRWYICNYCSKEFKKPSDLIRHIRVHTKEKPYKCHYCKTTFSLKSTLITHMNTHRSDRQFKCSICDRTFNTLRLLNNHLWKHEEMVVAPKFQCVTCGFLCENQEIGNKHQIHMRESNSEHIIERFDKISSKYDERINTQDSDKSTDLICHLCSQKFSKKISLFRHLTYHSEEKNYLCQLCKKILPSREKLREHLENEKHYECKQCEKSFAHGYLLKRHMKVHTDYIIRRMQLKTQESDNFSNSSKLSENLIMGTDKVVKTGHIKEEDSSNIFVPYVMAPLNDIHILNIDGNIDPNLQKLYMTVDNKHLENETMNITIPIQNFKVQTNETSMPKAKPANEPILPKKDELVRTASVISRTPYRNRPNIIRSSSFHQSKSSRQVLRSIKDSSSQAESEIVNSLPQFSLSNFNNEEHQVIDYSESRNILENANIICVNCSCLHSNFNAFQNHVCNVEFTTQDQQFGQKNNTGGALKENNQSSVPVPEISALDVSNHINKEGSNKMINESEKRKNPQKPIECHLCKRTFTDRPEYKNHLKIHSKARRYECSICKKLIVGRIPYMKHLNDLHSDENGSMLRSCKYCSKEFKKPSDLARHLRVHTGEKPFTCQECKRNFSLKSTLESHMRTHKPKVRPFNCLICNVNFTTKATLKVHQTIHTGAKPFKCPFCDVSFRTSGHRKSHVMVAHLPNRRRHAESRKAKIRRMLESVASTILNDMEAEQRTPNEFNENTSLAEISNPIQHVPSDSLEATVAAVNTITDPVENVHPNIATNELMVGNNLIAIDSSININNTVALDSTSRNDPNSRDSDSHSALLTADQIEPIASMVSNEQMISAHMINTDSMVNENPTEHTLTLHQSLSNDRLVSIEHMPTSDLTTRTEDNVLNSIAANKLTADTVSLLQQLQPSTMVLSSENDSESIPLILDDVTLLNIELAGENMQIISLSDLESSIVQSQPTHGEQENTQKLQKMRNHRCYICNKMYASKDVLRKHIKTVHFKNGFRCNICDAQFNQKRKLDVHMRDHEEHTISIIADQNPLFLQGTSQQSITSRKQQEAPTVQYDLLTENIGDALFANIFPLKKAK